MEPKAYAQALGVHMRESTAYLMHCSAHGTRQTTVLPSGQGVLLHVPQLVEARAAEAVVTW